MQAGKIVRRKSNSRIFSIVDMTETVVRLTEMSKENHQEWLDPNQDMVIIPVSIFLLDYEELL